MENKSKPNDIDNVVLDDFWIRNFQLISYSVSSHDKNWDFIKSDPTQNELEPFLVVPVIIHC